MGPNVKKLIAHKMSIMMVPPGGGIRSAIQSLTRPGNIGKVAREATEWVNNALAAVRTAPNNPYGNDDEAIAATILAEVDRRNRSPRPHAKT